jgi:hypothetical protein
LGKKKKKKKGDDATTTPPLSLFGFYVLTRMATAILQPVA